MQKTNSRRKDQTRFNPCIAIGRMNNDINAKHANHWSNARIKPGLNLSSWIHFLHTGMKEILVPLTVLHKVCRYYMFTNKLTTLHNFFIFYHIPIVKIRIITHLAQNLFNKNYFYSIIIEIRKNIYLLSNKI